jgi:hypothetical protein
MGYAGARRLLGGVAGLSLLVDRFKPADGNGLVPQGVADRSPDGCLVGLGVYVDNPELTELAAPLDERTPAEIV